MVHRFRNRLDLAAAAAAAVLASVLVVAFTRQGLVPVLVLVPVGVLAVVAARLAYASVSLDDDALEEVRPTGRHRIRWDDVERLVILDRHGRRERRAGAAWMLAVVLSDGRTIRIPTVRGVRAPDAAWTSARARLFAEELCTWHALRAELRNPRVGPPSLRLVSGDDPRSPASGARASARARFALRARRRLR